MFARVLYEQFLVERSKTRLQRHPQEANNVLIQVQCGNEIQALLENSKNQKQFIAGAKEVWVKFRTSKGKVRRGRPSEWRTVIREIRRWYEDGNRDYIFETATDYQLIQHVHSKQPGLNKDTIRKYVKLWRLTWTPPWVRSIADWRWLQKYEPGIVQDDLETIKHLYGKSIPNILLARTEERISAALQSR